MGEGWWILQVARRFCIESRQGMMSKKLLDCHPKQGSCHHGRGLLDHYPQYGQPRLQLTSTGGTRRADETQSQTG